MYWKERRRKFSLFKYLCTNILIFLPFFRFNFHVCGGRSWCFHWTNILLHGCATLLLAKVCFRVLRLDWLQTLIAGTLFALHPIHTEAVSGTVSFFQIRNQCRPARANMTHYLPLFKYVLLASCSSCSRGVKHMPCNPKVVGLNPANCRAFFSPSPFLDTV